MLCVNSLWSHPVTLVPDFESFFTMALGLSLRHSARMACSGLGKWSRSLAGRYVGERIDAMAWPSFPNPVSRAPRDTAFLP